MKTFADILEILKDVVSEDYDGKKIFDKDIATLLGITQMNFATMKNRNKIPYNELLEFCAKRGIAINWLMFDQSPESLIESTNRYFMVRYFNNVNASAGGGGYTNDESFEELPIDEGMLTHIGGKGELKHIEAINVSGDSMEPTFGYGDIIFINRNRTNLSRGGIFTISTEHGLFVKRIIERLDGMVDIISDNKEYPPQTIDRAELTVIGQVIGRFGRVD